MKKIYPDFYPKECPPNGAYESEIVVFRYIKNNPPTDDDFKSYYELNPIKYKGIINAYGLSVISNYESAINALNQNPALRKKFKYVSRGLISKKSGVIKETPSPNQSKHITWWVCKDYKACSSFKIKSVL